MGVTRGYKMNHTKNIFRRIFLFVLIIQSALLYGQNEEKIFPGVLFILIGLTISMKVRLKNIH